jgi:branched-chain amino acid transport system permease protein
LVASANGWRRSDGFLANGILQILFNGIASGALYAIVALGFGLIFNTTRIFHLAHGAVYAAAGYLFFTALVRWNLPIYISLLAGMFAAVVLGILLEVLIYQPLREKNAPLIISFISSLGVYVIVQNLIALVFGNETQIIVHEPDRIYRIAGISAGRIQLLGLVTFLFIVVTYALLTSYTRMGKSLKGISDNPELAELLGINVAHYRLGVFACGSLLAGIGAMISALDLGIAPNVGFPVVIIAVASVIVGGVGVFEGALIGGLLLGITQALSTWYFSATWLNSVTFVVLIAFLALRPAGLLGYGRRVEESHS